MYNTGTKKIITANEKSYKRASRIDFLRVQFLYRSLKRGCLKTEFLDNIFVRVLGQMSSFEKTRHFPTLSCTNRM